MQNSTPEEIRESLLEESAELPKAEFIRLVEAMVKLRELQYASEIGSGVIERAQKTVARNLPSNLLRAAAIFVDHAYGFPRGHSSFQPPAWVTAKKLLPENERGLLACVFRDEFPLEEKEVVVLMKDIPEHGLHAGMAGIIREISDEDDDYTCTVEFGEPQISATVTIEISNQLVRRPRPGDLLEDYRQ